MAKVPRRRTPHRGWRHQVAGACGKAGLSEDGGGIYEMRLDNTLMHTGPTGFAMGGQTSKIDLRRRRPSGRGSGGWRARRRRSPDGRAPQRPRDHVPMQLSLTTTGRRVVSAAPRGGRRGTTTGCQVVGGAGEGCQALMWDAEEVVRGAREMGATQSDWMRSWARTCDACAGVVRRRRATTFSSCTLTCTAHTSTHTCWQGYLRGATARGCRP